ncbi:histidine kinase, partial [Spirillospora sp. NPDC029432]|uniref:sensor histidine kinase n=1 Tax=Spirillospora sp. NPDC029432 TaxID=3154599 RepID=UPI00345569C4
MNGADHPDLSGPPGRVLRALTARPTRRAAAGDALLWAVLMFPVVAGMTPQNGGEVSLWLQAAGVAAFGAAVAVGRAWPLAPLATVIVALLIHANFVFALPVVAYLAGLRMARARPILWIFTATFVGGTVLNLARGIDVTTWFPLTIWLVLLGVLPWLVGRYWRQYRELLHAGWQRAEQLEREHRIVAERERLRERSRIAQDMHDSLGHELALIAVRAGALQVAPDLPERHRAAAAELRAGAAEATDHLREVIGVLRESTGRGGGADPDPESGLAGTRPARESITDLVDRAAASGIPVRLTGSAPALVPATGPETPAAPGTPPPSPSPPSMRAPDPGRAPGGGDPGTPGTSAGTPPPAPDHHRGHEANDRTPAPPRAAPSGPPPPPVPAVAPMVALAAHRVVQEALTNAAKHAPGAPVTVRLEQDGDTVTVAVTNQAAPPAPAAAEAPAARAASGHRSRTGTAPATAGTAAPPAPWRDRIAGDTAAVRDGAGTGPQSAERPGGGYGLAGLAERVEAIGGR